MERHIEEALYPLPFRTKASENLGNHIKNRHNVVLVGMKRVGISNFLRFFLNRKGIKEKYITDKKNHLFIPIDLNDLVERELFPFWVLTLKRIEDAVVASSVSSQTKKYIETLFLDSIQSQDLFMTIDCVRKSLVRLVEENITPTIFFLRFDRMQEVVTPDFFSNLQGLVDACHKNLSYVFTSVRSLETLSSTVFTKASVSVFARTMYIEPGTRQDSEIIFDRTCKKYGITIGPQTRKEVLSIVNGYTQYLQFALTYLHEKKGKASKDLLDELLSDERIALQSEELLESLTVEEKEILMKIVMKKSITSDEKEKASYLWNTGIICEDEVFSKLFERFLLDKGDLFTETTKKEFSKKEHTLLKLLEENRGMLCERETIIETVWPEAESYGVSDWAVDRLVARLRLKLKNSSSDYEIVTVKTRGFKLL